MIWNSRWFTGFEKLPTAAGTAATAASAAKATETAASAKTSPTTKAATAASKSTREENRSTKTSIPAPRHKTTAPTTATKQVHNDNNHDDGKNNFTNA